MTSSNVVLTDEVARAIERKDYELAATLHVLSAPLLRGRVESWIDVRSREIHFPRLLDNGWSSGEGTMVEVACSLWGRPELADARLSDILDTLDEPSLERVIQAIRIRRGRPPASETGGAGR